MGPPFTGRALERREDPVLVTGRARYTDDITPRDAVYAAFVRSPHGHARIRGIDASAAEALDGVRAVFTAADVERSGVPGAMRVAATLEGAVETDVPFLASDEVRFAGEAVALVVADDRYAASDAVDLVDVDYERRDAVVDVAEAGEADAPTVHEAAPDNTAFDWTFGDEGETDAAFADADRVATVSLRNQRLIGDPMEPRTVLASFDGDELTVTMASQAPYLERAHFAETLGLPEAAVRVVAPAVGGGFGVKGRAYPDEAAVAWCAMQVDRPVKWTATRAESHRADYHSRDWVVDGALALDGDGRMRGLRVTATQNVGAYYVHAPSLTRNFRTLVTGQYRIPAVCGRMRGAFTNTTPIGIYRGAGRPEVAYFLERLVDTAAGDLGIDPAALRRRNLVPADAFPYETASGSVYDSGDYERALDLALETVEYADVRARQAALREEGRYLGVGVGCFVENSGSGPGFGETGRVSVTPDGTVRAALGTHDHGQGHGTTFAQVVADELEVDYGDVVVEEGDTALLPRGGGTFGSRSAALGGSAVVRAAAAVRERAREVAADELEVDPADLTYGDGAFAVEGAPQRSMTLREVAAVADASGEELASTADYDPPNYGYSFGAHVAVVEVDPETGDVAFDDYVAVDDCGVVINPTIVEGQVHGGVAQGVAQALLEGVEYDENGTLLTGSLQDYALPKAHQIPEMVTRETVTPSPHNPLGVKGTGESGTIAATPAVANAVVDALRPFGVDDVALPATPETVWRAIRDGDTN